MKRVLLVTLGTVLIAASAAIASPPCLPQRAGEMPCDSPQGSRAPQANDVSGYSGYSSASPQGSRAPQANGVGGYSGFSPQGSTTPQTNGVGGYSGFSR